MREKQELLRNVNAFAANMFTVIKLISLRYHLVLLFGLLLFFFCVYSILKTHSLLSWFWSLVHDFLVFLIALSW